MLYAFLGSLLLGSLSTVFLLWRKAKVESELKVALLLLDESDHRREELAKAIGQNQEIYTRELDSRDSQIQTLRTQRDQALDQLAKTGAPGSVTGFLRLRNTKA